MAQVSKWAVRSLSQNSGRRSGQPCPLMRRTGRHAQPSRWQAQRSRRDANRHDAGPSASSSGSADRGTGGEWQQVWEERWQKEGSRNWEKEEGRSWANEEDESWENKGSRSWEREECKSWYKEAAWISHRPTAPEHWLHTVGDESENPFDAMTRCYKIQELMEHRRALGNQPAVKDLPVTMNFVFENQKTDSEASSPSHVAALPENEKKADIDNDADSIGPLDSVSQIGLPSQVTELVGSESEDCKQKKDLDDKLESHGRPMFGTDQPMTKCLSSFSAGEVDWEALAYVLAARCSKWHVYCKPLLVRWYNELRRESAAGSQLLEAPEDALAFVLYSGPGYLDTVVEHFMRTSSENLEGHFVDGATDHFLSELCQEFNNDLCACTFNLDKGPPYFHAQSLGVVAGIAQHIDPTEVVDSQWHEAISAQLLAVRGVDVWGSDEKIRQKIFGVSVHPELGGWYAYRGLLILHGARAPTLQKPEPLQIVSEKEKRRILEEYNLRGDECRWRDLTHAVHLGRTRYTPEEMLFFTEMKLEKRRMFLQMKADILSAPMVSNQTDPLVQKGILPKVWGANPALVESLHSGA